MHKKTPSFFTKFDPLLVAVVKLQVSSLGILPNNVVNLDVITIRFLSS
jgi:hypothetical protein